MSPTAGDAANLFPVLTPKAEPTPSPVTTPAKARTRPVANTSALPEGAPIVGAQLAGLAALALAFVLAVTRLSIRRRPTAKPGPETPDKPDADKSDQSDQADKADRADKADQAKNTDKAAQAANTDKPADQPESKDEQAKDDNQAKEDGPPPAEPQNQQNQKEGG